MKQVRLAYKILLVTVLAVIGFTLLPAQGAQITPIFASATTATDALHPVTVFTASPAAKTVPEAFAEANLPYRPADHISVLPALTSGLGGVVTDVQALPVAIIDGTKNYTAYTWATTVGGLLNEQNMTLGDQDELAPARSTVLTASSAITIVRVAVTTVTQTGPIAFSVIKKDDPTLNKGSTKVPTRGVNGVMTSQYRDTRKDGVTVSHVLLNQTVTTAPVSEVYLIGTKPVITVPCAGYDNQVLSAAIANKVDPNLLCKGLIIESNGHAGSIGGGGQYVGLFQFTPSFWAQAAAGAGLPGANIMSGNDQIKVAAWAIGHGYASRWFWA